MGKGEILKKITQWLTKERSRSLKSSAETSVITSRSLLSPWTMSLPTSFTMPERFCLADHKGDMIIGKNTLIKKALQFMTEEPNPADENYEHHKKWTQKPELKAIEPLIKENVGLIFSEEPYTELKEKIEAEKISMPARTGVPAPCDVVIPGGPTGVEVGKIDLFH